VSTTATTTAEKAGSAHAVLPAEAVDHVAARRAFPTRAQWGTARFSLDASMLALGVVVAETGWRAAGFAPSPVAWLAGFALLSLALLHARGAYVMRLRPGLLDEARRVAGATTLALMAVTTARVILSDSTIPSAQTVRPWLFATACVLAGRGVLGWADIRARRRGDADRATLIVGAGTVGTLLARRLLERPELGLRPVGFLDKEPREEVDGLPVLGASWDLERVVEEHGVENVLVTFSTAPNDVLLRLAKRCEDLGVEVSFVPRLFERMPERLSVDHVGGLPLVTPRPANPRGWQFAAKYAFDRVAAAAILTLLLPLFAAVALAILATTGRPIFFRQNRVGLDGRTFGMLKFRTMDGRPEEGGEADADWAARELGTDEAHAVAPSEAGDRRTPVGRILRATSIDELPQLVNVLLGEMSLVGPRPERAHYAARFEESIYRYAERYRVKSGMTGWAQVNGLRGRTSLADRVEWDNFYIENWSLWLDLQILLSTPVALLTGRGE
jgi:exopolysaccharide biosynthesis polyprenyl glycosylphosphotransferase